ncbi:4847_t:CDS:2, partial [Acaulospora morrowiae]
IPLLAYQASSLLMIKDVFLYLLAATTINFGGIGNFIQYLINEGLFSPIVTDPSIRRTTEPKIHLSSSENTIESNETGSQRLSSIREDKGEESVGDYGKGYTLDNNHGGVCENNGYDENRDSKIDKDFDEVNPKDVEE